MNRQEELLSGGRGGGGRCGADRQAATGDLTQTLMAQVLAPCWDQVHMCIFESSQSEGSYVGDLLSSVTAVQGENTLHIPKSFHSVVKF